MGIFSFGRSSVPVGLDIGTNLFRAAQLAPASPQPILVNYGFINIPVGAVVEGEIADVEAASFALSQLWKKSGLTERNVTVGIASQRVVVRLVELPFMEPQELQGAIQYQAQDYIPIPVEEAIIDAQIVGEFLSENEEKMMEVLLVAAQKDTVNNTVRAVEAAGLRPQVIDLSAFAIVRSLLKQDAIIGDEEAAVGEAVALINISSGLTNIVVVEQQMPRFARVTPMAGNDLTQAIADQLGLTFDEAELLKVKVGLPAEGEAASVPDDLPENLRSHAEAAQNILENQISYFVAEVRRSLDYYLTQATQVRNITRLVVSGNGSKLKNFTAYLEKGLQAKVEAGNPLAQVQIGPKLSADQLVEDQPSLAVSVGLALRGI